MKASNLGWMIGWSIALTSSVTSPQYGQWNFSFVTGIIDRAHGVPALLDLLSDRIQQWTDRKYPKQPKQFDLSDRRLAACQNSPNPNYRPFDQSQWSLFVSGGNSLTGKPRSRIEQIIGAPACIQSDGSTLHIPAYNPDIALSITYSKDNGFIKYGLLNHASSSPTPNSTSGQ